MTRFSLIPALLISTVSLTGALHADDGTLYAEPLPDDASFVRFIGFGEQTRATFAGFSFALSPQTQGQYIPVSSADLTGIAAGSYTSVLRKADGTLSPIPEAPRARQAKVALVLVNGTDTALALRLADGSVDVIGDVLPASSSLREVNPVAITLGVFRTDQTTALATFDVALRRGQNLSFVADETGVHLIENQFAPLAK